MRADDVAVGNVGRTKLPSTRTLGIQLAVIALALALVGSHLHDGEHAHAVQRDQQERHDSSDLGMDGDPGEYRRISYRAENSCNQEEGGSASDNKLSEQMLRC